MFAQNYKYGNKYQPLWRDLKIPVYKSNLDKHKSIKIQILIAGPKLTPVYVMKIKRKYVS